MSRAQLFLRAGLLALFVTMAGAVSVYGQPIVSTDKWDYSAGDNVRVTGMDWEPGETVSLTFAEDPQRHDPVVLSVVADEHGNFVNSAFVVAPDDSNTRFTLHAAGQTPGRTAQALFVDSPWIQISWDPLMPGQQPNPVKPGGTATYSIKIQVATGSPFQVNLRVLSGLPAGATASFSPNPVSFSGSNPLETSTLTITTPAGTPLGDHQVTFRAEKVGAPADYYDHVAVLSVRNVNTRIQTVLTMVGQRPNEHLGHWTDPAGDYNGDGYPDIIVGNAISDPSMLWRAYILLGGPDADDVPDLVLSSGLLGDYFGMRCTGVGDINGDGYDDVAVTAQAHAGGSGRVYVYFGGPTADTVPDLVLEARQAGENFGSAVGPGGDVNGDGHPDLIVGALGSYSPSNPGHAYVYYGGPSLDGIPDFTFSTSAENVCFGQSAVCPGDLNGDGLTDIVIGAPRYSCRSGRVFVYFGSRPPNSTPDLVMSGDGCYSYFGGHNITSAGDLDGDGYEDLLVSVAQWPNEWTYTGRALVYFGGPAMDANPDLVFTGEATPDHFGGGGAAGDINGDGYDDLVLSADGNDLAGGNAGRLYFYFGGPSVDNVADLTVGGERPGDNLSLYCLSPVVGDFNADGRPDLLTRSAYNNEGGSGAGKIYVMTVGPENAPPVLATIPNQVVNEMTLLHLVATASDPDLPPQTLTFSLEPGAPEGPMIDPASGAFTWTPTEAQGPGDYTVTVKVTDSGTPPLSDQKSFSIHVNEVNRPPVLAAIADQTVNEMTSFTFTAAATDPDLPANTLSFSLEDQPSGASIDPLTGQFEWTPAEDQGPGVYDFVVKVTDNGSPPMSNEKQIRVTVNEVNRPPVLAEIAYQTVDELTLLTFTATASDPDLPKNTLAYALVDAIEGMSIDPASGVFTWTPTEAQGPLEVEIGVRVSDDGVPPFSDEKRVHIHVNEVNVSPTLTVPGPITVGEGATVSFTATATDPDLPANTLTFSLVDPPPGATIDEATGAVHWLTVDDGSYVLRVSVSDGASGADVEDVPVTVQNVAPTVSITGPPPNLSYEVGSTVVFTGSFTDPGTADTHTAQWSFGTLTQSGTVDEAAGTVSASYTFTAAGVYPVRLTVTDDDGGAGIATQSGGVDLTVVVYDLDGGFVTGHGWMTSPAGAYLADPSRTGRATFGFLAKYQRGSVPTGDTEFEFRAAGLLLESTGYEWLAVVSPRAQFQGVGTLNGAGSYGFLVTALDGSQLRPRGEDGLRVKIWERGTGQLVYDNQLGAPDSCAPATAIGAGAIVVQRGNSSGGAGQARLRPALEPASPSAIAFALRPAMPNPFRGSTALAFDLPEASEVRLTVHDVTGRQVAELANGALEPGRHERRWEGRDRSGRALEAGVYFVRIEVRSLSSAGGLSMVRKIVRIK